MRLRTFATPALLLLLAFPFFGIAGCPQPETKSDKDKSEGSDDDKKKKSKDDDDGEKKKKKKKEKDESDDDDDKKKKKDDSAKDDDAKKDTGGVSDDLVGGRLDAGVIAPTAPIPPGCAPDPAGKLGAKPKLLASGGQPGASLAVWGKAGETVLSDVAITIHADEKCYVDYVGIPAVPSDQSWMGYAIPKGAVQAMSGISERGSSSFVGFRVVLDEPGKVGTEVHSESRARFYGYVHANGIPYTCNPIPGEKGCGMYQKPLVAHTATACVAAKGGGPGDSLAQIKIKQPQIDLKKPPPALGTVIAIPFDAGVAPSPSLVPGIIAIGDAGADTADSGTCNGPVCSNTAFMIKESDHIYVRVIAGKPKACDPTAGAHVGETWYFDESTWKKR